MRILPLVVGRVVGGGGCRFGGDSPNVHALADEGGVSVIVVEPHFGAQDGERTVDGDGKGDSFGFGAAPSRPEEAGRRGCHRTGVMDAGQNTSRAFVGDIGIDGVAIVKAPVARGRGVAVTLLVSVLIHLPPSHIVPFGCPMSHLSLGKPTRRRRSCRDRNRR